MISFANEPSCNARKRTIERSTLLAAPPSKKIRTICSSLPQHPSHQDGDDENDAATRQSVSSPQEYLEELIKSNGGIVKMSASLEVEGFFVPPTDEEIEAYQHDVLNAVRTRDIEKLREFHQNGRPLKCSNQFGESLLHLACRKGFMDVVSYLVKEAGVTVRVIDDYGRTPMHDVCWTAEPNFELLEFVMKECIDLLFMRDRRGNTPLEYARREHWGAYVKFLSQKQHLILPTHIVVVS